MYDNKSKPMSGGEKRIVLKIWPHLAPEARGQRPETRGGSFLVGFQSTASIQNMLRIRVKPCKVEIFVLPKKKETK